MKTATPTKIEIDYAPRNWARLFHAALQRFAVLILHRRAGKTTAVMNHHQRAALSNERERVRLKMLNPGLTTAEIEKLVKPPGGRNYGHCLPTRTQAKLVAWEPMKYYARGIPGIKINESELYIRYPSGNKFQLFGADNPDALRGPAFSGFSFDEYSQQDPSIFTTVISKALADHLGWAVFCGTIKGKDHLYRTWDAARSEPGLWFALWQDIHTSLRGESDATVKMLRQAMDDDRKLVAQGIMAQDEFDQEWELSTEASIKGAYFAKEMLRAKTDGRIRAVPYDPAIPVVTAWDLGMDDSTAIWFAQFIKGGEVRLIDYYENSGEGIAHYANELNKRGYTYGKHIAPHDIAVRELGTGKSRIEVARGFGIRFETTPDIGLMDGIHASRVLLARCYFDATKTAKGLEALRHYKKRYNTALNEFSDTPVHDQYSHGADAFRMLAVGQSGPLIEKRREVMRGRHGAGMPGGWMKG